MHHSTSRNRDHVTRNSRLNLLLIGEESAGIQALRALAPRADRIVAVMASQSRRFATGASLWTVARCLGYQTWPAELVKDPSFADRIAAENIDVILNVHSLHLIDLKVLTAPRIGSFNMHPGPLPGYAGLNTVSWAIYRGETSYGVTIHEMTGEIDGGRIAFQARFPLEDQDTPMSLTTKCIRAGIPDLWRLLDTAATHRKAIPLVRQDLTKRRYFGRQVPHDGAIFWDRPAQEIANFVRACDYHPFTSPWGHPRARAGGREILVTKVSRTGEKCPAPPGSVVLRGNDVRVACADEWIVIHRIRTGQRPIDPTLLLRAGDRLEDGFPPGGFAPIPA